MPGGPFKSLKGQAALDELMARDPGMPDWQAKQVLATARTYTETTIPIEDGWATLTIQYEGGYFMIGGYYGGKK